MKCSSAFWFGRFSHFTCKDNAIKFNTPSLQIVNTNVIIAEADTLIYYDSAHLISPLSIWLTIVKPNFISRIDGSVAKKCKYWPVVYFQFLYNCIWCFPFIICKFANSFAVGSINAVKTDKIILDLFATYTSRMKLRAVYKTFQRTKNLCRKILLKIFVQQNTG